MNYQIVEIKQRGALWDALLAVAPSMDAPIPRYLNLEMYWIKSNHILVAVSDGQPIGVLRFVTQRLGEDEERPPIVFNGEALVEGKVIAFGVLPECRRQGIGRAMQYRAMELAKEEGCYQFRSRVWYESIENFNLQLAMKSAVQPSLKDDSVYFILLL